MKINRVTISGADDSVDVNELVRLQNTYPFVEWGILVSRKRNGTPRYPSVSWYSSMPRGLNVSLHLCGEVCRDVISGVDQRVKFFLKDDSWRRVQLNYSFKDRDYAMELERISKYAEMMPDKAIIVPYNNGSSKNMISYMRTGVVPPNVHFLHDQSGGRGREIAESSIMTPFKNYTGYAGGLGPDNVDRMCKYLTSIRIDDQIWIDMETGVRTDDVFDLAKVEQVLSIAQKYVQQ